MRFKQAFTLTLLALIMLASTLARAQDTPFTQKFPGSVESLDSLGRAKDGAQSTLSSGITPTSTQLTVVSGSLFPTSGAVLIGNSTATREIVYFTARSGNTLTGLLRGRDGTTAQTWSAGVLVSGGLIAAYHNTTAGSLISTQAKLGAQDCTPSTGKYLRGTGAGMSCWQDIASADITIGLGYTPENVANKNQPNGYPGLDASGKVLASVLPSNVSDDLVVNSVTASGDIHAARLFGNGAGITGLTGATGGVANTGSTTIGADIDSDGDGQIDLQIALDTVARFTPDKRMLLRGRGGVLYDPGRIEYDIAEFTSLSQAITTLSAAIAAGDRPKLKITKNVVVTNEVIPVGVTTQVLGGYFTGTDGQTFSILGPMLTDGCARSQIFFNFNAGGGTVSFSGNKDVRQLCPEYWGGKSDSGTTDNTGPIQAAATAANSAGGGVTVKFARSYPNFYAYNSPLNFDGFVQVIFEGEGHGNVGAGNVGNTVLAPTKSSRARLDYTGAATMGGVVGAADAISCDDCDGVQFRSLALTYSNPAYVGDLISFDGAGVAGQDWIIDSFLGGAGGNDATWTNNAVNARSLVFFRDTVEGGIRDSALQMAQYGVIGVGRKADNSVGTGGNFSNGVQITSTRFQFFTGYAVANMGDNWKIKDNVFEYNPTGSTSALTGNNRQCRVFTNEPFPETVGSPRGFTALVFRDNGVYDCFGGGSYFQVRGAGLTMTGNMLNVATGSTVWKFMGTAGTGYYITQNTFTGGGSPVHIDPTSGTIANSVIEANGGLSTKADFGYATRTARNFQFSSTVTTAATVAIDATKGVYYFDATAANVTARLPEVDTFGNIKDTTQAACLSATAAGHVVTIKGKTDAVLINGTPGSTAGYVLSNVGQCAVFINHNGVDWLTYSDANRTPSGVDLTGATGTVLPANGGTGTPTAPTSGQVPVGTSGGIYAPTTVTASNGVAVTPGSGSLAFSGTTLTGTVARQVIPDDMPFAGTGTTDAMADVANQVKCAKFRPRWNMTITKMSFRIAVAGTTGGWGVYTEAGAKINSANSQSLAATGEVTGTLASTTLIVDSNYYACWSADTTAPTFLSTAAVTSGFWNHYNVSGDHRFVTAANAMASGVMPSTLGTLTDINATDALPIIVVHN